MCVSWRPVLALLLGFFLVARRFLLPGVLDKAVGWSCRKCWREVGKGRTAKSYFFNFTLPSQFIDLPNLLFILLLTTPMNLNSEIILKMLPTLPTLQSALARLQNPNPSRSREENLQLSTRN